MREQSRLQMERIEERSKTAEKRAAASEKRAEALERKLEDAGTADAGASRSGSKLVRYLSRLSLCVAARLLCKPVKCVCLQAITDAEYAGVLVARASPKAAPAKTPRAKTQAPKGAINTSNKPKGPGKGAQVAKPVAGTVHLIAAHRV